QVPDEAVIERLTQIKGIGRWTAEMFLIFSLGRPDVLPVDDLGFRDGVRRVYALPELPRAAELRARAEPWRPYRSFATWYFWRSPGPHPAVLRPPDGAVAPHPDHSAPRASRAGGGGSATVTCRAAVRG